ncbi:ammonium transporter [Clostridium sp.]|jgi:Amt family ammonium transporter|uniref:ammonium transporter n=1 Tax=Clostridium sp. TaxID=1506 RepID=UPI0025BF557F|nr:ammonium transporter [Clostridium sp.]MCI9069369.1 ammonium transporter [Clostridium sp.]
MYSALDTIWTLLGATLVFFMQAGFAMVETGFTRAKNAGNIIMKNLMDFAIGTVVFWFIGFGLMFAGDGSLIGGIDFFIQGDYSSSIPTFAFVIFQTVFCATAATIVSGAMAERTKFSSYCLYSLIISAIIYPISGHWIWGGGFLSQMGFHDFAGSTAVHMVGGVAALIGAKILGPRIGKYSKDGTAHAIPGHSLTLGALGVFILWFAWFGFNGCSTVSMTGNDSILSASSIFMTTNMAAATATVTVMIITWIRYKKPDVSMTLNGSLAGLVAITAGCDMVTPVGAFFIGLIAGFAVVFAIEFIEKKLKIDDPVGAVSVHGVCGCLGTILTGLFAVDGGLFYGGGFSFLSVQLLGVISVIVWVAITMTIVFLIIKHTVGLRVSEKEEIEGLDKQEHGLESSYADFMPINYSYNTESLEVTTNNDNNTTTNNIDTIPVVYNTSKSDAKFTKIVVLTKKDRFEILKVALDKLGITGMTVTNVLGYGMQKGSTDFYRGVPLEVTLLPKVKVEIVVCKIPVDTLVKVIKKALYTGKIGDGKIFIENIENVIKIRTNEEGYDALQDEE